MYFIKKKLKAKVLRHYYSEVTLAHSIFGINQYKKRIYAFHSLVDLFPDISPLANFGSLFFNQVHSEKKVRYSKLILFTNPRTTML
jgi:hypothetical protein